MAHSWLGAILPYVLHNKAIRFMDEGSSGAVGLGLVVCPSQECGPSNGEREFEGE